LLFCGNSSQIDAAYGSWTSHALYLFDMLMTHGLGDVQKAGYGDRLFIQYQQSRQCIGFWKVRCGVNRFVWGICENLREG